MSAAKHSEFEENFLRKPSKVDDLLKFLTDLSKSNKMDTGKDKEAKVEVDFSADVTDGNFMVMERCRNFSKRSKHASKKISLLANLNQMSFMRQIDSSQEERSKAREDRERVANSFRRLGNAEYRKVSYEKAIEFYTKGLQYISDSPVLFVNRGLCYIKKREFKRALIDLDHVIINLDGRCLRAWLYRAGAQKRMNNEAGFEECIQNARRLNRANAAYIEYFLEKMRTDF